MAADVVPMKMKVIQFWNDVEATLQRICQEGLKKYCDEFVKSVNKICAASYSRYFLFSIKLRFCVDAKIIFSSFYILASYDFMIIY